MDFNQTSENIDIQKMKGDFYQQIIENSPDMIFRISLPDVIYDYVSPASGHILGITPQEIYSNSRIIHENVHPDWIDWYEIKWKQLINEESFQDLEYPFIHKIEGLRWLRQRFTPIKDTNNKINVIIGSISDITLNKAKAEDVNKSHYLTKHIDETPDPVESKLSFEDLFDINEIQKIQDIFSAATGVASIITQPNGNPITKPSNFCRLCIDVIRKTEKGLENCMRSDAIIGRPNKNGPNMHPCYSCGLWDGGASIWVGDRHIGNWLVGQVRNQELDYDQINHYANQIGADEKEFTAAFEEVSEMSTKQFHNVCDALFLFANNLSQLAYQNLQQRRLLHQKDIAERALRESETHYHSLVDNLPHCIFQKNAKGQYLFVNKQFAEQLGISVEDFIGKTDYDFFPNRLAQKYRNDDIQVMETKQVMKISEEFQPSPKRSLHIQVIKAPLTNSQGEVIGIQGFFIDITEKYNLELELQRSRKLESIGLLAGGIAHDFNNLLTAILGNISYIKVISEDDKEIQERLSDAETASLRARNLTQQLLTFSKGGAPIKKTISIVEIIKDTAKFALRGSNVNCECHFDNDLWFVNADSGQVSQVIQNIVINANQAMPCGGSIIITGKNRTIEKDAAVHSHLSEGKYVQISIQDFGVGIPEENLTTIFDPYFTTKTNGNGLGLATSHSIITRHGGTIKVESAENHGTTFMIFLPASFSPMQTSVDDSNQEEKGCGKILVMDDEELVRNISQSMLKHLGYEVILASNGKEAVERYRESFETSEPFDCMITDLTIPGGMGGKETLEKILQFDPHVCAIVASGYSGDPIMSNYSDYGFKGVITKPYQINDISTILKKVLHKH